MLSASASVHTSRIASASHSKVVYEEDGDKEKDEDTDSFYLNNFRYGAQRCRSGFRSTDLFFNYDINELFRTRQGT